MGSNESHFNASLIVRDKVKRQRPQTTTFEEQGESGIKLRSLCLPATRIEGGRKSEWLVRTLRMAGWLQAASTDLRHPSFDEGVGKQCSVCGVILTVSYVLLLSFALAWDFHCVKLCVNSTKSINKLVVVHVSKKISDTWCLTSTKTMITYVSK